MGTLKTLIKRVLLFAILFAFIGTLAAPASSGAQGLSKEQKQLLNDQIFRFNFADEVECEGTGATPGAGAGSTDGSQVDRFLQVIAHQESNGNPNAQSGGSTASGKYQYINSTWRSVTGRLYPPAGKYPVAKAAPEAFQDAVAKLEYTQKFKQLNSDVFKLAISHFSPAALENPALLDAKIGNNTITPRGYANSVVKKMNTGVGLNIGLHYNEAPEFAKYFEAATKGAPPPVTTNAGTANPLPQVSDNCAINATGAITNGNCGKHEKLTVPAGGSGVNICYFNQSEQSGGDYDWGGCGCLPTSVLMMQATFENKPDLPPVQVLDGLRDKGGVYSDGCSGVIGGGMRYLNETLKYKVTPIRLRGAPLADDSLARAKELLAQGYVILAHTHVSIDSAGAKGTAGHFLLVHGVDAQGNFYVANPGARADNGKAVSPDRIKAWLDELIAVRKVLQT